jgi:hypothetical protein
MPKKGRSLLRVHLHWDWDAFRRLTSAMYDVAVEVKGQPSIETWIAEGFWYCDTFISAWTSHPNFPRPPEDASAVPTGSFERLSFGFFCAK